MCSKSFKRQGDLYENVQCPICQGVNGHRLYQRNKRAVPPLGHVTITVVQCDDCGFVFNNPRIRSDILEGYYHSSVLASGQTYRDESSEAYYPKINHDRAVYFTSCLAVRPQGKLLDIGCGVGGFLDAIKSQALPGWDLCGLEPSQNAAAMARAKGYCVEEAFLGTDKLENHSFDAITMLSVLEHVRDPRLAFVRIRELLKPDGIVFIEVPSLLHPELTLTGYFSMEHILHFTPGTLASLFRECGWKDMMNDPLIEDHGLRLVGSVDLSVWGQTETVSYEDDPVYTRAVVKAYADAERDLVDMINRRVRDVLQRWKKEGLNIAVYGAGIHTLELLSLVDLAAYCSVILDADPQKQGQTFLDFPVYAPQDIFDLGIDAVLISSQRFQDEIKSFVETLTSGTVEIAVCYDNPNNNLLSIPKTVS